MTAQQTSPTEIDGAVSIGSELEGEQDPRPNGDEPPDDQVSDEKRNREQPTKDVPTFPPGSPENRPPGSTSS